MTPQTPPDHCPYCNAELNPSSVGLHPCYWVYNCETFPNSPQSKHCKLLATSRSARAFVDFCDHNLGPNADWPMRVAFDDDGSGKLEEFCRLLNNLKAQVKPEAIQL